MIRTTTHVPSSSRGGPTAAARSLLFATVLLVTLGVMPAAHAAVVASIANGTLTVTGTTAGERLALRRGAPGRIVLDVGDNGSANFSFVRSRFTKIVVNAKGGNDRLRIDESKGVFTNTEATTLNGQAGVDVVLGGSAHEVLRGGTEADTVDGDAGNDDVGLGAGNDSFVWNIGDGADEVRGDADTDTVTVNGSASADAITVSPSVTPDHLDVNGGLDITTTENLVVNGLGGNDTLSAGSWRACCPNWVSTEERVTTS